MALDASSTVRVTMKFMKIIATKKLLKWCVVVFK